MAVTLSYIWPATGATPPTQAQMADTMIVDVTASADGDTTATIPHLMGPTPPQDVTITPILSQALAASSGWSLNAVPGATNVVCTKLATTGSGSGTAQLRVIIRRPNSIGR